MITAAFIFIGIVCLSIGMKLMAVIFSATFTIAGAFFKLALGLVMAIAAAYMMFYAIGFFSIIVVLPIVLIGIILGKENAG